MALLQDDFWPALFRSGVGCGAVSDDVPSHSAHFASCFLELERLNQELRSKLCDDFISILNGVGRISLSSTLQPPSPSPTPPSGSSPGAPFVTEAYSWLLENIVNPYPSSAVKKSLAQRHDCPLSTVNSWFVNARRRLGWTALCRDYFHNCRADAVDAAYRALVKEDPNRQLPADVIHAFISVKVAAEEFCSTVTKNAITSDLETIVEGVSDRCRSQRTMRCSRKSVVDLPSQELVLPNRPASSNNPSPSSSVHVLDEPPASETRDDQEILPSVLAGSKRRFFSSEEVHTPVSQSTTRSMKRSRPNALLSTNACLSSLVASAKEPSKNVQIPLSVSGTQSSTKLKTRKRRLSHAADIRLPKRPQESTAEPRLHAVSELPLSVLESEVSVDEWFKTNFDTLFALPAPADVAALDLSAQWEVELFNGYKLPENLQKVATPLIQGNQLSLPTDMTVLDDLLQTLESGGFATLPEITQTPTTALVSDPISQGLPLLPDLSQFIGWASLNEDPSESTSNLVLPRLYVDSASSRGNLSMLQLPHVWTAVAS